MIVDGTETTYSATVKLHYHWYGTLLHLAIQAQEVLIYSRVDCH